MAQEYKVTKISQDDPRLWPGPHGDVYYIKVKLEGHERAVEIGKKDPKALREGDTVFGNIIPNEGYPADKFKSEQNPTYATGTTRGGAYTPRPDHHEEIKAQWAIGQAVSVYNQMSREDAASAVFEQVVEENAAKLFAMVERVKSGSQGTTSQSTATNEGKSSPAASEDVVDNDIGDEPINLDDIPF